MLNILKSDFYKLKKSKAFWICTALCLVFGVLMVTAFHVEIQSDLSRFGPGDHDYDNALLKSQAASAVWGLEQFLPMNFNVLLVGVFIAVFVTSEFSYGTIKNTLSRGADRVKVFFSKFIVCGLAAVIMQTLFISALLTAGSIVWGFDPHGLSTPGSLLSVILSQMLAILSFAALFTFISTAMRSNGGSIATNIICSTMVSMLFTALSMLFGGNIVLNDYWIGGVVSKLATVTPASGDVAHGIIVTAAWGIASVLVGTTLFNKMDVILCFHAVYDILPANLNSVNQPFEQIPVNIIGDGVFFNQPHPAVNIVELFFELRRGLREFVKLRLFIPPLAFQLLRHHAKNIV